MTSEQYKIPEIPQNVFMVALTGCSTSGKTTLGKELEKFFQNDANTSLILVHQDTFYYPDEYIYSVLKGNWEVKEAVDWQKFIDHISLSLKQINPNRQYLFLVDGFTLFYVPELYNIFDAVIFMHLDDENVIQRRLVGPWNDTMEYLKDCVIADYKKYKVECIKQLLERQKEFIVLDGRIPKNYIYQSALSWLQSLKKN
ncbi:hypothetical protein ABPG74_022706 [Tetrahymena malaccensis]